MTTDVRVVEATRVRLKKGDILVVTIETEQGQDFKLTADNIIEYFNMFGVKVLCTSAKLKLSVAHPAKEAK